MRISLGIQTFLGQCTNGLKGTNNYARAAHAYKTSYASRVAARGPGTYISAEGLGPHCFGIIASGGQNLTISLHTRYTVKT